MLPTERRIMLVTQAIKSARENRARFIQRLAALPGGFRAVTLQGWGADKIAREVVRRNAESPQDELDLLHFLYVELEPEVQSTFLDTAGVRHDRGTIDESLDVPYCDADAVRRGAAAVRERHGAQGEHYLRTIARYNAAGWPGIDTIIEEMDRV